ncbi:MAG: nucleotidyl transferase AbiEii/AbiGii toxin family protein, partial [Candidatus Tectomicrobia bacterium]|nr:nucleotidyl transferase AbiEii/AbiGii toxin family protein [Candidatus Tectomicrobia bacterium]
MGQKGYQVIFHEKILTAVQKKVLQQLGSIITQWQFYLVGGTALAVHFGHRHSVDLDWFTGEQITDPMRLAQEIRDEGIPFLTGQIERGTLHGTVSGVRVSFLEYQYRLLNPPVVWPEFGCLIASLEDLACMKLSAVAQRGAKKDFIDIYALGLKHCSLWDMLRLYQQKYSIEDIGHLLYSLTYFSDADRER